MNTNYPIAALHVLLRADCLLARFAPLVPHRDALIAHLTALGCRSRDDCLALPDETLQPCLPDAGMLRLFRAFLRLYDVAPAKLRELTKAVLSPDELSACRELYHLPGVRLTRALLYDHAGFRCLEDVARATPEEIIARTWSVIRAEDLPCTPPLPKEARTHIAVAKAFTGMLGD